MQSTTSSQSGGGGPDIYKVNEGVLVPSTDAQLVKKVLTPGKPNTQPKKFSKVSVHYSRPINYGPIN